MTRQRALKRRIRARMAKTGESYSTARREVLKRLGTAVPEQDDAPAATVPGRRFYRAARRFLPGAALVALVGAIVAVVVIGGGDEDAKQPSVEQQVSPAEELPSALRAQFERRHRDLDRVQSVGCVGGHRAQIELWSSLIRSAREIDQDRVTLVHRIAPLLRSTMVKCDIRLRGGAVSIWAKIGGHWREMLAPQVAALRAFARPQVAGDL
jgi:hypothetical protein